MDIPLPNKGDVGKALRYGGAGLLAAPTVMQGYQAMFGEDDSPGMPMLTRHPVTGQPLSSDYYATKRRGIWDFITGRQGTSQAQRDAKLMQDFYDEFNMPVPYGPQSPYGESSTPVESSPSPRTSLYSMSPTPQWADRTFERNQYRKSLGLDSGSGQQP
jgi:hypothetical protein